jgi:hypothetical protein
VLDALTVLQTSLRNRACYGNEYVSMMVPFKRFLRCPKCGSSWTLDTVYENQDPFDFEWEIPTFTATCPSCKTGSGYRGPFIADDQEDRHEDKLHIRHWSPHEIELVHDYYSDDVRYLWRIPDTQAAHIVSPGCSKSAFRINGAATETRYKTAKSGAG